MFVHGYIVRNNSTAVQGKISGSPAGSEAEDRTSRECIVPRFKKIWKKLSSYGVWHEVTDKDLAGEREEDASPETLDDVRSRIEKESGHQSADDAVDFYHDHTLDGLDTVIQNIRRKAMEQKDAAVRSAGSSHHTNGADHDL